MDPVRSGQPDQRESPGQPPSAPPSESLETADKGRSTQDSGGPASLVAVPVDPYVVHCQWEVTPAEVEGAQQALGVGEHEAWPVLQIYDVTNAAQGETPPQPSFSVEVELDAGNWYVRSCSPDHAYRAELALKAEEGSRAVIASSSAVETPPSAPSSYADEHWLPIRPAPRLPETAPVPFPIDMSAEVRGKLAALYGEWEPVPLENPFQAQAPADRREEANGEMTALGRLAEQKPPDLSGQSSLPIDMREEVRKLLSRLYQGLEEEPSTLANTRSSVEEQHVQNPGRASGTVWLGTQRNAIGDLTELNERSFASGVSSRTH